MTANKEVDRLKSDLCKLVEENNTLRKRLVNIKDENDKRYNKLWDRYDEKHTDLSQRLERANVNLTKPRTKLSQSRNTNEDDHRRKKQNGLIDSQAEQRATKYKFIPTRSLKGSRDNFGFPVKETSNEVFNSSTRQVSRKNKLNKVAVKTNNTREYRMNKFGLQDMISIERE
jgi:hypothetical protein